MDIGLLEIWMNLTLQILFKYELDFSCLINGLQAYQELHGQLFMAQT